MPHAHSNIFRGPYSKHTRSETMEHLRNIQDLIDQHRESLPTGALVELMEECQHAYERLPRMPLWKVFFVELSAASRNKIAHQHKTLIA